MDPALADGRLTVLPGTYGTMPAGGAGGLERSDVAEIGSVLSGRYRLMELLGQGGMATIYRAHDAQLDRAVAVKVIRPEYGRDPDFLARFRAEAQAAASLNHPNVVAVYDSGEDPAGSYIVMELVDGEDLASLLRRNGPLPPRQAARIAAEVARALAAAHGRGLVHRDIKSSNILIARDGRVKVGDFGIARALAEAQVTLPGTTLGSVHYFSPEQSRGEQLTEATDIYSLGIVLFEMLTGRRPWEGESAASVAMARLTGAVPVPSDHRAGIPAGLEAIDRKALAFEPSDRFTSAGAMADALESFLADRPPAIPAAPAGPPPVAATAAAAAAGGPPPLTPQPQPPPSTVASGVARVNPPSRVPYPPEAYAGAPAREGRASRASRPPRPGEEPIGEAEEPEELEERPRGGGVWVWIAGLLGLVILAVAGFLVFRLVGGDGGTGTPPPQQVAVPSFVGQTYEAARSAADEVGLVLDPTFVKSNDQPEGAVTDQDPAAGTQVDRGSAVKVTVATGRDIVRVPDLRGRTESDAINAIVTEGLAVGLRSDAFDPLIPLGSVVSQEPRSGLEVASGTPIDYVVSKGPETSPSPSPSPSPEPTPIPTPEPTPVPSPSPSPEPSPEPTPVPSPSPSPEPSPSPSPEPSPSA